MSTKHSPNEVIDTVFGGSAATHKLTVTVPSTVDVDRPLPAETVAFFVERVSELLSQYFGGATATNGYGSYVANDGTLVTEDVTLVSTFFSFESDTQQKLESVRDYVIAVRDVLGQESMLVTVESVTSVHFI